MKKKNENPSFPIDEDEDLQEKMKEKGEIMEVEQPTFAMEERARERRGRAYDGEGKIPLVGVFQHPIRNFG